MHKISITYIKPTENGLMLQFSHKAMLLIYNTVGYAYGYYNDEYDEDDEDRDWERPRPDNCPRLTRDDHDYFLSRYRVFKEHKSEYETFEFNVNQLTKISRLCYFAVEDNRKWEGELHALTAGGFEEFGTLIRQLTYIINTVNK